MQDQTNVYQSLITARSRRLRTIGLMLLVAVLGMSIYGGAVLMPSLRQTRDAVRAEMSQTTTTSIQPQYTTPEQKRLRAAMKAKIIFAYGYWGVCLVLLTTLLIVAWMDFREITRRYLHAQVALLAESARDNERRNKPHG